MRLLEPKARPWFGVVIVASAWLLSLPAAKGLISMLWSLPAIALLSWFAMRKPAAASVADANAPSWAHGPLGRVIATCLVLYQIAAVASTQIPEKDSWSTFRAPTNDTFRTWLATTQTSQGWGMFAPNPPRRNVFMRVMVTDIDGEVYDLNTDVYACFMEGATEDICEAVYPMPWIWYSRRWTSRKRPKSSSRTSPEV